MLLKTVFKDPWINKFVSKQMDKQAIWKICITDLNSINQIFEEKKRIPEQNGQKTNFY